MIEARSGSRNTHRFSCDRCSYEGLWLKNHAEAERDGVLHGMYVHHDHGHTEVFGT